MALSTCFYSSPTHNSTQKQWYFCSLVLSIFNFDTSLGQSNRNTLLDLFPFNMPRCDKKWQMHHDRDLLYLPINVTWLGRLLDLSISALSSRIRLALWKIKKNRPWAITCSLLYQDKDPILKRERVEENDSFFSWYSGRSGILISCKIIYSNKHVINPWQTDTAVSPVLMHILLWWKAGSVMYPWSCSDF